MSQGLLFFDNRCEKKKDSLGKVTQAMIKTSDDNIVKKSVYGRLKLEIKTLM